MKVLLIGIDGADLRIIKEGTKRGMLPTFQSLMNNGVHGELISTIPPATAPAWVSMTTGVNPGKHGIFDFVDWKQGRVNNSLSVKASAIWDIIGKHSMKSILVNVPLTYPPKNVNGIMIPGIPLPQRMVARPDSLRSLLERNRYVSDFSEYEALKYAVAGKERALLRRAKEISESRTAVVLDLLSSEKWNFFMVVYIVLDRLQHVAFHRKRIVYEAYKIMDGQIKRLLNHIDDDTTVLITSDHGFTETHKVVYVNEILRREGLIHLNHKELSMIYHGILHLMASGPQRSLIPEIFEALGNKLGNKVLDFSRGEGAIAKMKARMVSRYGQYAYIHLKNPRWESKITATLRALKDSENDIIESIATNSMIFEGPYTFEAPELIVKLSKGYSAFTLMGTPKTVVDVSSAPEPMTGIHRQEGILLATCRNTFKPNGGNVNASICDICPSVLALLGIPIPRWTDGKPIMEILRAAGHSRPSPSRKSVTERKRRKSQIHYTREDEEEIKKRLRSLGYM